MKKKLLAAFALMMVALAAQISAQVSPEDDDDGGGRSGRLVGTWDAVVSITNCATGDVITSFQSTGSFHKGGTFTGVTSGTPPANRTPEVGIWRHVRRNEYEFRFKAYLFNPAGAPIAYQIITHTINLDRDNEDYTSAGDARIFAMNGTQIGAGCSSSIGTRMMFD